VTSPIPIGLIGCGRMGMRYLAVLQRSADFVLRAACDSDPEALAPLAAMGLRCYTEWQSLVEQGNVSAVIIATPPKGRAALVTGLLDQGLHCLIEKPLAADVADAQRIVQAAQRSKAASLVGFHERHNTALRALRDGVRAGVIGDLRIIRAVGQIGRRVDGEHWLGHDDQGGGALFESSVHNLDLVRWLSGDEFERVFAVGRTDGTAGADYTESFCAVGVLTRGTLVEVSASFSLPEGTALDSRVEVVGAKGTARYDLGAQPLRVQTEEGWPSGGRLLRGDRSVDLLHHDLSAGAHALEVQHFAACIRQAATPAASVGDGLRAVRVAEAIRQSMRTSGPVSLTS